MPHYNTWTPRTGIWGNQLDVARHFRGPKAALHWVAERQAERAGEIGSALGSVAGMAGYGLYNAWNRPSSTLKAVATKTKSRTRTKTKGATKTKVKVKSKVISKPACPPCVPYIPCGVPAPCGISTKNKILSKNMARRRTYKKKSRKGRKSYRLPPLAVPRSRLVRFRQVFNTGKDAQTGAIGTIIFKANSLNDPGGTATAILPLGLDQWAAQYGKYIVLGSKITVRGAWTSTANTGPCVFGVHLSDNNTALTSAAHYKMLPATSQRILSASKDYGTVTLKYSGKKFWKLTNIKDDSEQEAVFSTTPGDPTDIAYYHLFLQDINGGQTSNVDFQVTIEFICLLTDSLTLAESSL